MNIFVTGATGWVGSSVAQQLLRSGYKVTGLARSEDGAKSLTTMGIKAVRATLDDLAILKETAGTSDGVIHTAFNHDFSRFMENAEQDRRAIETLGEALEGSDRPLIVTSGLSGLPKGANEFDIPAPTSPRKSEASARKLAERWIRVATIRLPPSVHGIGEHGFISMLIRLAQEKGVSAYLGEGQNCWSGVHRLDAARAYLLALEHGIKEPVYHAIADEAIPFKKIAEKIGAQLGLPVEPRAPEHFGWFARMAGADMTASSARTRDWLDWKPIGPNLFSDLDHADYYKA